MACKNRWIPCSVVFLLCSLPKYGSNEIDAVICNPSYIKIEYAVGMQGHLSCIFEPKKADIVYIKWWYKQSNTQNEVFGVYTYISQAEEGIAHTDVSGLRDRVSMEYAQKNSEISLYINNTIPEDTGLYECTVHGKSAERNGYIYYQVSKTYVKRVTCKFQAARHIAESVNLICSIKPSHSSIVYIKWWFRKEPSGEEAKEEAGLYTYIVQNSTGLAHSDIPNMERRINMEYHKSSGKVVLTVNNLVENDTGIYSCEVFSYGLPKKDFIRLVVTKAVHSMNCSQITKNSTHTASVLCVYGPFDIKIDFIVWKREDTGISVLSYLRNPGYIDRKVLYKQDPYSLLAQFDQGRLVLTIDNAHSNASGLYSCEISNRAGYRRISKFHVTVLERVDRMNKTGNTDLPPVNNDIGMIFGMISFALCITVAVVIYFSAPHIRMLFNGMRNMPEHIYTALQGH